MALVGAEVNDPDLPSSVYPVPGRLMVRFENVATPFYDGGRGTCRPAWRLPALLAKETVTLSVLSPVSTLPSASSMAKATLNVAFWATLAGGWVENDDFRRRAGHHVERRRRDARNAGRADTLSV